MINTPQPHLYFILGLSYLCLLSQDRVAMGAGGEEPLVLGAAPLQHLQYCDVHKWCLRWYQGL